MDRERIRQKLESVERNLLIATPTPNKPKSEDVACLCFAVANLTDIVRDLIYEMSEIGDEVDDLAPKHAPGKAHLPPMAR